MPPARHNPSRPPDNAAEFTSRNKTSNAFLGVKQKPWMTGQTQEAAVLRPGKRRFTSNRQKTNTIADPSSHVDLHPQPSIPSTHGTLHEMSAEKDALSRDKDPSHSQSTIDRTAVLPSPAPSVEEPDFEIVEVRSKSKENTPLSNVGSLTLQEKRKNTGEGQQSVKRVCSMPISMTTTAAAQRDVIVNQARQLLATANTLSNRPSAVENHDSTVGQAQNQMHTSAQSPRETPAQLPSRPSPNTTQGQSVNTPHSQVLSSGLTNGLHVSQIQSPAGHHNVASGEGSLRRNLPLPPPAALQQKLQVLNRFVDQRGGAERIPPDEDMRITVLRTACTQNDYQMLLLHQCVFLYRCDRTGCPADLNQIPNLEQAMCKLEILLGLRSQGNTFMNSTSGFYTTFPFQLPLISQTNPNSFNAHLTLACRTLEALGTQRYNFTKALTPRGLPPLIHEIVACFYTTSPLFQQIIHTAACRALYGSNYNPSRCEPIFAENVRIHSIAFANVVNIQQQRQADIGLEAALLPHYQNALGSLMRQTVTSTLPTSLPYQQQQERRASMPVVQHSPRSPHAPSVQWPRLAFGGPAVQSPPALAQPAVLPSNAPNVQYPQPHVAQRVSSHQQVHQSAPLQNLPQHVQPQVQQPQRSQTFIPLHGFRAPQPANPDPLRTGLHQIHLRSPILRVSSLAKQEPMYRQMSGFALHPLATSEAALQRFTFDATAEAQQESKEDQPDGTNGLVKTVTKDSKLYRIRCIEYKDVDTLKSESVWIIQDTKWPKHASFSINGQTLELRRKLHFGRDLPIDITSHIRTGPNTITMALLRTSTDVVTAQYAIAVEIITLSSQSSIKDRCLTSALVPAEQILANIIKTLSIEDEEDDFAIVGDSFVNINLFDTWLTTRMPKIPVRGKSCLHRDCFDLDHLLETRPGVKKLGVSDTDVWKCPRCRGDVRPSELIVDGFLMAVKKKLEVTQQTNAGIIQVDAEGKWRVKGQKKVFSLE